MIPFSPSINDNQEYVGEIVEASDTTPQRSTIIGNQPKTVETTKETADNSRKKRIIKKEPDPGQFLIPCSINGVSVNQSLCDTGANVNVMSQALANKLGIRELKQPKMTIEVPNAIEIVPGGFIQDVMVEIEGCLIPTDFLILDGGDTERPIILGSSFLTIVEAVDDFRRRRIVFTKVNRRKYYPLSYQGETARVSDIRVFGLFKQIPKLCPLLRI